MRLEIVRYNTAWIDVEGVLTAYSDRMHDGDEIPKSTAGRHRSAGSPKDSRRLPGVYLVRHRRLSFPARIAIRLFSVFAALLSAIFVPWRVLRHPVVRLWSTGTAGRPLARRLVPAALGVAALVIGPVIGAIAIGGDSPPTAAQLSDVFASRQSFPQSDRSADGRSTDRASRSQSRSMTPQPDRSAAPPASPSASPASASTASSEAPSTSPSSEPAHPTPVGGLSQVQMDYAKTIVDVGKQMGLPRQAFIVAISTALQESDLLNLANSGLSDSLNLPHDGVGSDHDSVGLFQQRPSAGWGTIAELMDPATAARRFYSALEQVSGWQDMPVTVAAQSVQGSAFPDAYAKQVPLATQIVDAIVP